MSNGKVFKCYPNAGHVNGVCVGLSKYFNVDLLTLRILFALWLIVEPSSALIMYVILVLISTEANREEDPPT